MSHIVALCGHKMFTFFFNSFIYQAENMLTLFRGIKSICIEKPLFLLAFLYGSASDFL